MKNSDDVLRTNVLADLVARSPEPVKVFSQVSPGDQETIRIILRAKRGIQALLGVLLAVSAVWVPGYVGTIFPAVPTAVLYCLGAIFALGSLVFGWRAIRTERAYRVIALGESLPRAPRRPGEGVTAPDAEPPF